MASNYLLRIPDIRLIFIPVVVKISFCLNTFCRRKRRNIWQCLF